MNKNKTIKIISVLICVITFLLQYSLTASSVNIDGYQGGVEWNGATADVLVDGESNCGVDFALVKTLIDSDNSALYLCFVFIDPTLEIDNCNAGVSIYFDGSEQFHITLSDSVLSTDTGAHSFSGAIRADENNGVICEIRIGFKFGLPETIPATVRFTDADGALSNVYNFSIFNNFYSETTELIIDSENKETTKAKHTAKKKTTRYYPEPETIYVYETKKKATTQKKTTKFYIQTSPPYSYVRKTKAPTTKKAAKTESVRTTKSKPASVYYYEKEIIISHVYISETENQISSPSTTVFTNNITTDSITEAVPDIIYSAEEKSVFSLSKGMNYKIIVLVFGAISFSIIAAVGVKNSKNNTDDNNDNPDSH